MSTRISVTLPSMLPRCGTAAACTPRPAVPGSLSARAPGSSQLRARAVARRSSRGMCTVAASGGGAPNKAGPALARPAAGRAPAQLGLPLIACCAAAASGMLAAGGVSLAGLQMAASLAVLLLVLPWMCKAYANWAAATTKRKRELKRRHMRRAAATEARSDTHNEMTALRTEYQQLRMNREGHMDIVGVAAIAVVALAAGQHVIEAAASQAFPYFAQLASKAISVAGWFVAGIQAMFLLDPVLPEFFAARWARRTFYVAAAERRQAHAARRGAALGSGHAAGQP